MTSINPVQTVTVKELATILVNTEMVKGMANFITISTLTEPRCNVKDRKTKEPFNGKIEKLSAYPAVLNTDYRTRVENQLVREGKDKSEYKAGFNSMPLDFTNSKNNFIGFYDSKKYGGLEPVIMTYPKVAKPTDETPENEVKFYDMWERFEKNNKPYTLYFLNGNRVKKSQLPDVLPTKSKAKNQGTDKEILVRKIYLRNVKEISINGTLYKVLE